MTALITAPHLPPLERSPRRPHRPPLEQTVASLSEQQKLAAAQRRREQAALAELEVQAPTAEEAPLDCIDCH